MAHTGTGPDIYEGPTHLTPAPPKCGPPVEGTPNSGAGPAGHDANRTMARLLWPVLLLLLFLAVAGPCLTFYLLIKDYWAEVSSLRRDLLFCQLGTTDLKFSLDLDNFPAASEEVFAMPPVPLPLIATSPLPATDPTTLTSPDNLPHISPDLSPSTTPPSPPTSSRSKTSPMLQPLETNTVSSKVSEDLSATDAETVLGTQAYTQPNIATSRKTTTTRRPFMWSALPSLHNPLLRRVPSQPPRITSRRPFIQGVSTRTPNRQLSTNGEPVQPAPLTPPHSPTTSQPRHLGIQRSSLTSPPPNPSRRQGRPWPERRVGIPSRSFRSLETVMVADESTDDEEDGTLTNMEYVALLEKQLRDMQARVNACRMCLAPPQRTQPMCGGGSAWREHRRRNKQLKRQQRRERKMRKKLKTSTETPTTTTTPPTTSPHEPLSDTWKSETDMKKESARARETHRMSTDFRRGFNQKISRMDDALMQFTESQSHFCKELRDNLGARLEKRGQELEALSDQIAALVKATTMQIASLEKLASDQMYSGQSSIEKNLAVTQAMRDSQLRGIQNYHKQTFLPAAAAIATVLSEQASAATSMGLELITKIEMLQDVYITYATQQADSLQKLEQEVDMFSSKHNNFIMRSKDHANHFRMNTETFIRELQSRMNNVVKELVLIRLQSQSFVALNNDSYNNIFSSLNKSQSAVDDLSQGLKTHVETAKEREQDFRKVFKLETNEISDGAETGVSRALALNHAVMNQIEETELDTRVFVGQATAAWNELYFNQESELRIEADSLTTNLKGHTHHTQNIMAGLRSAAETHEQVLEEQRMDFQGFIRKRQDALDTQCSAISDWAMLMSSELRRRDEDLHRFLSEDLQYTTVSVHGGSHAPRLPDNTWEYQSSPAHAPANVSYQLDETAYSISSASPAPHSSRYSPQSEKTVVTVNTSSNALVDGGKSTAHTNIGNTNTSYKSNEKSQHLESNITNGRVDNSKHMLNNLDDNELPHISNAAHNNQNPNTENKHDLETNHLGLISELDNKASISTDLENNDINDDDDDDDVKIGHKVISQPSNDNNSSQVNVETALTSPLDLFLHKTGLKSVRNRQNDGTYKPKCFSGCRSNTNSDVIIKENFEDSEEDDEGIKNLRKILKEAQVTIKKFQLDFETDNTHRKNLTISKPWDHLDNKNASYNGVNTTTFNNEENALDHLDIHNTKNTKEIDVTSSEENTKNTRAGHKTRHHHGEGHVRGHGSHPGHIESEDIYQDDPSSEFLLSLFTTQPDSELLMEQIADTTSSYKKDDLTEGNIEPLGPNGGTDIHSLLSQNADVNLEYSGNEQNIELGEKFINKEDFNKETKTIEQ